MWHDVTWLCCYRELPITNNLADVPAHPYPRFNSIRKHPNLPQSPSNLMASHFMLFCGEETTPLSIANSCQELTLVEIWNLEQNPEWTMEGLEVMKIVLEECEWMGRTWLQHLVLRPYGLLVSYFRSGRVEEGWALAQPDCGKRSSINRRRSQEDNLIIG